MGPINPYFNTVAYQTPASAMPAGVSANASPAMVVPPAPATPAAGRGVSPMLLLILLAGALFVGHKKTQPEETELADDDLLQADGEQNWDGPESSGASTDMDAAAAASDIPTYTPSPFKEVSKSIADLLLPPTKKEVEFGGGSFGGGGAGGSWDLALPESPKSKPEAKPETPTTQEEETPATPEEDKDKLPAWAEITAMGVGMVAGWATRIVGGIVCCTGAGAPVGAGLILAGGAVGAGAEYGTEAGLRWFLGKNQRSVGWQDAASFASNTLGGIGHAGKLARVASTTTTAVRTTPKWWQVGAHVKNWLAPTIAKGEKGFGAATQGLGVVKTAAKVIEKTEKITALKPIAFLQRPGVSLANGFVSSTLVAAGQSTDNNWLTGAGRVLQIADITADLGTSKGLQGLVNSSGDKGNALDNGIQGVSNGAVLRGGGKMVGIVGGIEEGMKELNQLWDEDVKKQKEKEAKKEERPQV